MPPSELYQTVCTAFTEESWKYSEVSGREVIRAGFEAHHTRVELHIQVFPELSGVSIVSESSRGTVEPARRERLAELAMKCNEMLTVGNFEMRWDQGILLYRVTNLFSTPQGDPQIIRGLIHATVAEMDRISPLLSIIMSAEGSDLAALNISELLKRDDLLPAIDEPA